MHLYWLRVLLTRDTSVCNPQGKFTLLDMSCLMKICFRMPLILFFSHHTVLYLLHPIHTQNSRLILCLLFHIILMRVLILVLQQVIIEEIMKTQ